MNQLNIVAYAKFAVNVGFVRVDSAFADAQFFSNSFRRLSIATFHCNLQLPFWQFRIHFTMRLKNVAIINQTHAFVNR